jgi:hypothetical protein
MKMVACFMTGGFVLTEYIIFIPFFKFCRGEILATIELFD